MARSSASRSGWTWRRSFSNCLRTNGSEPWILMPTKKLEDSRANQRRRTRKDLLAAAARLLQEGKTPGMDAVAAAAMVSRATVYRYFPNIDALLIEAPLDRAVPSPAEIFADDS